MELTVWLHTVLTGNHLQQDPIACQRYAPGWWVCDCYHPSPVGTPPVSAIMIITTLIIIITIIKCTWPAGIRYVVCNRHNNTPRLCSTHGGITFFKLTTSANLMLSYQLGAKFNDRSKGCQHDKLVRLEAAFYDFFGNMESTV